MSFEIIFPPETVYNVSIEFLTSLFGMYLFDVGLQKLGDNDKKRRWYLVHAIVNTIVTFLVFPDLIHVLKYPLNIAGINHYTLPLSLVLALHVFHIIIDYKQMTIIDWIHHLVLSLFVGVVMMFLIRGPIINYGLFFLSGFPGGIDYYMLALNKYGLLNRITEKRINVSLNMWIRLPGILSICVIGYVNEVVGTTQNLPYRMPGIIYLMILFNAGNAIFFASRVAENYGRKLERLAYLEGRKDKVTHKRKYADSEADLDTYDN